MSATLDVRRALARHSPAPRPAAPGLLLGVGLFAGGVAGSLMLLRGGFALTNPHSVHLDRFAVAAAVLTSAPLIAWRRHPTDAFIATAAASIAMAAAGYPVGLPLAPAVALYLLLSGVERTETGAKVATLVT